MNNQNQENPFLRKILFRVLHALSCNSACVILHVCKHTASLTPNIVIPYQGSFLRKEKPRSAALH